MSYDTILSEHFTTSGGITGVGTYDSCRKQGGNGEGYVLQEHGMTATFLQ